MLSPLFVRTRGSGSSGAPAGAASSMPPWKIYRPLSVQCDVDYMHRGFAGCASSGGEASRDNFSDRACAISHKKKLITTEPRMRLKNLHLEEREHEGADSSECDEDYAARARAGQLAWPFARNETGVRADPARRADRSDRDDHGRERLRQRAGRRVHSHVEPSRAGTAGRDQLRLDSSFADRGRAVRLREG